MQPRKSEKRDGRRTRYRRYVLRQSKVLSPKSRGSWKETKKTFAEPKNFTKLSSARKKKKFSSIKKESFLKCEKSSSARKKKPWTKSERRPNRSCMTNMKDLRVNSTKKDYDGRITSTVNMIDWSLSVNEIKTIWRNKYELSHTNSNKNNKMKRRNKKKRQMSCKESISMRSNALRMKTRLQSRSGWRPIK